MKALLVLLTASAALAAPSSLERDASLKRLEVRLAAMVAEDQAMRFGMFDLQKKGYTVKQIFLESSYGPYWHGVDRKNTEEMKAVLKEWGWPGYSLVGEKGSNHAWLLVQHADHDVAFQETALGHMTAAVDKKDASPRDHAYLHDRVAVNRGRKQRYGTQGTCVAKGVWEPRPIEDEAGVDARRKALGLGTMKEPLREMARYCF